MSQLRSLFSLFGILSIGMVPTTSSAEKIGAGERLRIVYSSEKEIGGRLLGPKTAVRGEFASASTESILLTTNHGDASIPVGSITSVERWTGTNRHTLTGALIGAPIFAALGWGIASSMWDGTSFDDISEDAVGFVVGSAVVGAIVGAMAGYSTETDRWEPVSMSEIQIGFSPRDGSSTIAAVVHY